jgi:hypothetical protein
MGAGCSVDRWGLVAEGAVPSAVVVVLPDPPALEVGRLEGATSVDVDRFSYSRSPAASRASALLMYCLTRRSFPPSKKYT